MLVPAAGEDAQWLDRLAEELHETFGRDMELDLRLVDEIPLTAAGKHRFIISEVKPEFAGGGHGRSS